MDAQLKPLPVYLRTVEEENPALRMPALGSEVMDPSGDTILKDWISNLN